MRRLFFPTLAALGALTSLFAAAPALAQTAAPAPAAQPEPAPLCQAGITKGARAALVALQTAVAAKDSANIPALTAAAQAVAKSNDDRCFIAQMQVKAAVDANNLAAVPAALEAQLASGGVPASRIATLYEGLGQSLYRANDFDGAVARLRARGGARFDPLERGGPAGRNARQAEPRRRRDAALPQGDRHGDRRRARRRQPVVWPRADRRAQRQEPACLPLTRDWLAAYPSAANWRDALRIYANVSGAGDDMLIDLFRLQRLTKSLAGESDHARYAQALITKGFAGEAKACSTRASPSKAADPTRQSLKSYHALATSRAAGDRASLDGQAKAALANPAAKPAMVLGEAYFGYGDYAKAADMFRAAQGKAGVDAELANLRLGMALAASGDKAGAATALAKVTGPRAEVARYWETYAKLRS